MTETPAPRGNIIAASLTPFASDRKPDGPALVRHCQRLLDQGCDAVLCLGSTGEANSLTVAERLDLLEELGRAQLGRRLMVGVGCCAAPDTIRLTRAALAIGATNVLALPPFYYKQASDEGLYQSYAWIIDEVADPGLRLFLYDIPQQSGLPLSHSLVRRLLERYPKAVAGIKDSTGDWDHTLALLQAFPRLAIFSGTERHLLNNLRCGGAGSISATFNISAPLAARLLRRWKGAEAEQLQQQLFAIRAEVSRFPLIAALKAALCAQAEEPSVWQAPRPPLLPLDSKEAGQLVTALGPLLETMRGEA